VAGSVFLGRHEPALDQFLYAMRLNPLDEIHRVEAGLAAANFFLHRYEIALSWANKSITRRKDYVIALRFALVSYVMLGRIAEAQVMQARLREVGLTLSQIKKFMPYQRQEDADLYFEAFRIAGMPE
jgi:tetratricopeptide (TPR) repeat protein